MIWRVVFALLLIKGINALLTDCANHRQFKNTNTTPVRTIEYYDSLVSRYDSLYELRQ